MVEDLNVHGGHLSHCENSMGFYNTDDKLRPPTKNEGKTMTQFAFSAQVNQPIDDAIETLKATLMNHHLGIVSDVDAAGIIKTKLGEEIAPYHILGACNPKMAKAMIEAVPQAGALLPCTIVARENEGKTTFDFMDPVVVLGLAGNEVMDQVAAEAMEKLKAVAADLP